MPDKSWYPTLVMLVGLVIVLLSLLTPKIPARVIQLGMVMFGVGLLVVLTAIR